MNLHLAFVLPSFVSSSILVTVHVEPPVAHQEVLAEHRAVGAEEGVDGVGAATCHVPPAHVEHLAPRHGRRVRVVTCSNNAVTINISLCVISRVCMFARCRYAKILGFDCHSLTDVLARARI